MARAAPAASSVSIARALRSPGPWDRAGAGRNDGRSGPHALSDRTHSRLPCKMRDAKSCIFSRGVLRDQSLSSNVAHSSGSFAVPETQSCLLLRNRCCWSFVRVGRRHGDPARTPWLRSTNTRFAHVGVLTLTHKSVTTPGRSHSLLASRRCGQLESMRPVVPSATNAERPASTRAFSPRGCVCESPSRSMPTLMARLPLPAASRRQGGGCARRQSSHLLRGVVSTVYPVDCRRQP